ncbi:unnamed protein product [Adineta ricciae]|uniref:Nuclear pore complex protein Nup98-Nup96 n=1 Tax=Adineta ricciae TaxID=249248 RepID=A0A814VGL4_ADIRI|nr:unnamed protein product [Adineta ricciae]
MFSFHPTTTAATTSASMFTFSRPITSQASNIPLFQFGGSGAQGGATVSPFAPLPATNQPANNANSNATGLFQFVSGQCAPAAQVPNYFFTNQTGTTIKFIPVASQETEYVRKTKKIVTSDVKYQCICNIKEYSSKSMDELRLEDYQSNRKLPSASTSVASNTLIFNVNPPITTAAKPFSTATTTNNIFNPSVSTVANPFSVATPTSNIFNPSVSTVANPFSTATTTSNIFNPSVSTAASPFSTATTTSNIFNPSVSTVANPFRTATTTSNIFNPAMSTTPITTFPWLKNASLTPTAPNLNPFGIQPVTTGAPMATASSTHPFTTTPATTSSVFTVPSIFPGFRTPTISTVSTIPSTNISQSYTAPFQFSQSSSILNQPSVIQSISVTQTPAIVPSSISSTAASETAAMSQQQFLTKLLLDPYGNRGRKEFINAESTSSPKTSIVDSTLHTTVSASTPIPVVLPVHSNFQRTTAPHSSINLDFKLKPTSSVSTSHEDTQSLNQQSKSTTEPSKSTLSGGFTDEEEVVLLTRTKLSKLHLLNSTMNQPNTLHSLYPRRSLAELESLTKLSRLSPPISTPSEQTVLPKSVSPNLEPQPNIDLSSFRLPILTRLNYYMKPDLAELETLFNDKGQCLVKQFTVGNDKYGSVTFYGQINVAGLNLDEIIQINHQEVIVYPDDIRKPAVGEELNRSARITLFDVYPIDRATRSKISDIERIRAMNYSDHLRETTGKFDGEFINYDPIDGSWTFMVKHFTRYGIDENEKYTNL